MTHARRPTAATGAAFAAQGFGWAVLVTNVPALQARFGVSAEILSLGILAMTGCAAGGAALAGPIAARWGSGRLLCGGLVTQAAGFLIVALTASRVPGAVALLLVGAGFGAVDVGNNMQGVLAQRNRGTQLMGRLYAGYTSAAIAGALIASGVAAAGVFAMAGLVAVTVVHTATATFGARNFDTTQAARDRREKAKKAAPLPYRGIWIAGWVLFAAHVGDSAVETWSTLFLKDGRHAAAAVAPLGYAAYQAAVLISRLAADALVVAKGLIVTALAGIVIGVAGGVTVAVTPGVIGALCGFAALGVATGVLVPVAFTSAGDLSPGRSDEVIARVNLFNYPGALVGGVTPGLLASGAALGPVFLIPAALLATSVPAVRGLIRLPALAQE